MMIGFTIASNLSSRNQPYTDRGLSGWKERHLEIN